MQCRAQLEHEAIQRRFVQCAVMNYVQCVLAHAVLHSRFKHLKVLRTVLGAPKHAQVGQAEPSRAGPGRAGPGRAERSLAAVRCERQKKQTDSRAVLNKFRAMQSSTGIQAVAPCYGLALQEMPKMRRAAASKVITFVNVGTSRPSACDSHQ